MADIKNSKTKWLTFFIGLLSMGMIAISGYLTHHYYQIMFPKSFQVGLFCDLSQFWNCDAAAFSPFGSIFQVPTSLFGLGFGFIILFGALWRKNSIVTTNFFLALVNLLGCIFLFAYSLLFLNGLCPGCTVYYCLSLLLVIVFAFLQPMFPRPKIILLALYALFIAAIMIGAYFYNYQRFEEQGRLINTWVEEVKKSPRENDSSLSFDFSLAKSTPDFSDAPLRITIFSDFQCPFCKIVGYEIEKIAHRYQGKINIRYIFLPLDRTCNEKVRSNMHPLACDAARLSYCAKDNFVKIHDTLYAYQEALTSGWLNAKAKELNLTACYESDESKEKIKALVSQANEFEIDGVPTLLINERKIAGLIPTRALITLFDALLLEEKSNKKS